MKTNINNSDSSDFHTSAGVEIKTLEKLYAKYNLFDKISFDEFCTHFQEKYNSLGDKTSLRTCTKIILEDIRVQTLIRQWRYRKVVVQGNEVIDIPAKSKCLQIRPVSRKNISFVEWLEPVKKEVF
ncbi:hypothetical protein V7O67_05340 [Methanolobus sp. ZRKC4]|uniref:hypothetical protein n=1 Tax=Methanolobus sp. ZRKC4 TaxID=3125787 RepID=UPI0032564BFE